MNDGIFGAWAQTPSAVPGCSRCLEQKPDGFLPTISVQTHFGSQCPGESTETDKLFVVGGYHECMALSSARYGVVEGEETKKANFIGGHQPKLMEVGRANAGARDPSAK